MTTTNPVVAALPGQGWRYVVEDAEGPVLTPVVGFLVHADGSVVAVAADPDYADNGIRPVAELGAVTTLLPPNED
ncbi:hypothetical protein ACTXG6_06050 [Pseudonocardia sp. Cha107L01]|uniref:hypothetical protein n=1 Tax=Pseudonocardia sp. Cha107L01 TaxID=3457576 RepID=UPI00403ECBCF